MFNLTRLVTLRPDASPEDRDAAVAAIQETLRRLPLVVRSTVRPVGEYAVNGGDVACHLQFADEGSFFAARNHDAWQAFEKAFAAGKIAAVDGVTYRHELVVRREPGIKNCLHRTLLLAIRPGSSPAKVAQFEAEMREMADYLPAIRNWSFSRVIGSTGARGWTHVWEQEFQDVGGLMGPYMMHPIHFAHIDRWFDSESQDWIVDPQLRHSYWSIDESVIAPVD